MSDFLLPHGLEDAVLALAGSDEMKREQAACQLAAWTAPWIRAVFLNRGVNEVDADALTVTVVGKVVAKAAQFEFRASPAQFKAWVQRIAYHEFVDWRRDQLPSEPLEMAERHFVTNIEPVDAEQVAQEHEALLAFLEDSIHRLKPREGTIIRMRFFPPVHEFKEIAAALDMTEGNARVASFRAVRRLVRLLVADPRIQKWLRKTKPE